MDGTTLSRIRETLMERLSRMTTGRVEKLHVPAENGIEIIDIAQNLEQLDRDESMRVQERRELRSIELALAKIAAGDFGICEDCGEDIPEKRLYAVPQARLCTRCQTAEERELSRVRGLSNTSGR